MRTSIAGLTLQSTHPSNPIRPPVRRLIVTLLALLAAPAFAVNNCSSYSDQRGAALVSINSVAGQNRYSPSCVRIAAGGSVRFSANFGQHPLYGGTVLGGIATYDPSNPVGAHNNGTTPVTVVFDDAGEYPFFCDFHFTMGMLGSVRVDVSLFVDGME